MVGRGRLLVVNHGEHHRRRLQKRNMAAPLHSHFSNDTLGFQDLFSRTGQAFFASFLSFFSFFFAFFFFFFLNATAYFAQFAIRGYAPVPEMAICRLAKRC